jgi:outer membrane protein assembly factor BamD
MAIVIQPRLSAGLLLAAALLGLAGCNATKPKRQQTNLTADRLYEQASRDLRVGDFTNAIRLFEALESRFPFANASRQAQLDLMYAYYRNDEPESAEDEADQFIRENPAHPRVDYAYYVKGLSTFEGVPNVVERMFRADLNKRPPIAARKSFHAFQTLVQRFPNSDYATDSRQRMIFLRNRLADYEIAVAKYYLERGAYVGAINRCKYALENYDGAPGTRNALGIMAQSYRELGMTDLAANADRVLSENFPNTEVTASKAWWKFW